MASPSRVAAAATCFQMQGQNVTTSTKEATAPHLDAPSASAYLCCSVEDPDEFQVDLCPRKWFCCCSNDSSGSGWSGRQQTRVGFLQIIWRICFVTLCLPLCYPCYLTRWHLFLSTLRWAKPPVRLKLRTVLGDLDAVGGDLTALWFLLRPRLVLTELQPAPVQSMSSWPTKFLDRVNQNRPRSESGSQEGWKSSRTFWILMIITQDFITSFFL